MTTQQATSQQDRGHAWLVCLASFLGYFLVTMGLCTSGILFQEYIKTFGATHTETAIIPSLQCSIGALLGVFIAPQVKKFGYRTTTAFGTVLGSFGYVLCSFANKIIHLYISLGVLVGIGNGFIFFSSAVAVQFHFNKKRALASALSTCGVSLAPFIFAPSIQWLISTYTWRGATLQMGAFYLNGFVAAGLMSPFKKTNKTEEINTSTIKNVTDSIKSSKESIDYQCNLGSTNVQYIAVKNSDESIPDKLKSWSINYNLREKVFELLQYMRNVFDFQLLTNIQFLLFILASSLNLFGHLATYLYIPGKVINELHLLPSTGASYISLIGISTTVGRLCSGLLGDKTVISKYRCVHFGLPMLLTGLSTVTAAFMTSYWQLYIYSVVFGFFTGIYFVAQQPLLVKILGVDNFPKSFGIMLIFTGGASMLAQPFAGWLVDKTNVTLTPLVVCGTLQAIGGIMAMATWKRNKQVTENI